MDFDFLDSCNMWWGTLGTIRPYPNFNPKRDVLALRTALEKKDAAGLVRILTNRTNSQRQDIAKTFEEQTQKQLAPGLRKALGGDLATLLMELLIPPVEYDAYRLQHAIVGLGTDEETLLEVLCTRSGKRLAEISAVYKELYKKDLEKDLKGETSGDFAKLVVALLHKAEVPGVVQRDVESLFASVSGKKVDAAPWIEILTSRDVNHLNKVFMDLELRTGQNVHQTVEKRFTGDFRLGLKTLVQCIRCPEDHLAKRLTSTKSHIVQGVMVSHSEEDLLCVRAAYLKLTGLSLYAALQKQFKGDYLQALLAICRSED
ncbi:annexin A2 [Betta splendens]|uniref:Annexin A2 n=1 Tax=Betta splendens TaxID=158456 RepID=A0A6P7NY01_BETSP|nr:annexin A2 [Betta splendens]XP_029022884.1 annexin A2 [Betta splendens]XP_040928879.1 annexin A2 [Betta splendens]